MTEAIFIFQQITKEAIEFNNATFLFCRSDASI